MSDADDSADLQRQVNSLQRQIVELRMQLDQQAQGHAALIDHTVSRAIDAKLGGRALTEEERDWVRQSTKDAGERKKIRSALVLHIMQWGIGGTVGFLLYSAWEGFKKELQK